MFKSYHKWQFGAGLNTLSFSQPLYSLFAADERQTPKLQAVQYSVCKYIFSAAVCPAILGFVPSSLNLLGKKGNYITQSVFEK